MDMFLFSESLKMLISETMVCWAQDTEMQNPELVKAVFSLLYRQYQGLGGQMTASLARTYTISEASVEDTMLLLSSLSQIRSLLSVRMSKEEENLMIRKLGYRYVCYIVWFFSIVCHGICMFKLND